MSASVQFVVALVAIVVIWGGYVLGRQKINPIEYFKTKTGLGILKGIVIAVGLAAAIALISSKAQAEEAVWFKDAEIFAGLEATQRVSPQCVAGGVDDKTTSNLGMRVNIYSNEQFRINSKYTHHSCAFGEDDAGYDAFGVELVYKFWSR